MLTTILNIGYDGVGKLITKFTDSPNWVLKSAVGLVIYMLLSSFPDYDLLMDQAQNSIISQFISWQVDHPFDKIPQQYLSEAQTGNLNIIDGNKSHIEKRWCRITVPVFCHFLGIGFKYWIWVQHLLGICSVWLILKINFSILKDKVTSLVLSLGMCSIFFTKWFYFDNIYFDGVAFLFMLVCIYSRQSLVVFMSLILALFTDERAIFVLPVILLWPVLGGSSKSTLLNSLLNPKSIISMVAVFCYFILRMALKLYIDQQTMTVFTNTSVWRQNFPLIPLGIFLHWEAFWLLFIFVIIVLVYKKQYLHCGILLVLFLGAQLSIFLVQDIGRSSGYLFPWLFLFVWILYTHIPVQELHKLLFVITICCVIFPTHVIVFGSGNPWMSPFFPKVLKYF